GAVLAEAEATGPNPDGEWRPAPARVEVPEPARHGLPPGAVLECTFAVEARFFAELSEARDLGEVYHSADALRADIQRSYVRAFSALLGAWALAAGLLGIILARRTTRRLSELLRAVRDLARGDLTVQVEPGRAHDEVASLARAFNRMVREVKESRDRLVYLEKISGWQEVARRLAHEIKNPLTPIQLAFQQLEAAHAAAPGQDLAFAKLLADAGEIVREEIGTLQRLVQEFSEFAKLPEVRTEAAELGGFVEEFVRTNPQLAAEAELLVTRGGDCPVLLDRALMRRVLANLARNAIEASRPERARVHLGVARTRERAVLTVADEGPGIAEELRQRIFDPYFTTRHEGTGLGLAIVKKIVLQHGGEIAAGVRPGGGASFTISLPLAGAAADVPSTAA
ncbi:MAG TPA: HAMP domain-containing sensor histidine kinase, partial [Anaeromyxobacteraceae bacterium]